MIITRRRRGESERGMIGSGRGGMNRASGAKAESEGNESDWELACCLLHAMKNKVSNQSAGSVCVCMHRRKGY